MEMKEFSFKFFAEFEGVVDDEGAISLHLDPEQLEAARDLVEMVLMVDGPNKVIMGMPLPNWFRFREETVLCLGGDGGCGLALVTPEGLVAVSDPQANPILHPIDAKGRIRLDPDAMDAIGLAPGMEYVLSHDNDCFFF